MLGAAPIRAYLVMSFSVGSIPLTLCPDMEHIWHVDVLK